MKPSARFFVHSVSCFTPAFSKDNAGAYVETFGIYSDAVSSCVQPAVSKVVELYARRNEIITHSIFVRHQSDYEAIQIQDLIGYGNRYYRVMGRRNSDELNQVFRLDVKEYLGDPTIEEVEEEEPLPLVQDFKLFSWGKKVWADWEPSELQTQVQKSVNGGAFETLPLVEAGENEI